MADFLASETEGETENPSEKILVADLFGVFCMAEILDRKHAQK